jgi:transcriptional antiterminator RfaH
MDRWYVVSTQPQKEERAREHLARQGFDVYLPRWRKRRSHARRIEWVPAPLFPRYLFVGFDIEITRWRAINSTFGVSHLVCTGGMPLSMPGGIVEDIRAREATSGLIEIKPAFRKGQSVIVGEGAFLDQIGLFERMNDDERVIILLNLLGREVRVKVPTHSVRAA